MKKVYITHSTSFDYKKELYQPLQAAFSEKFELILPHNIAMEGILSRDIIPTCDFVLAEVSYPSTGQGIELGWANISNVPIVCFYRKNTKPSGALSFVTETLFEYTNSDDLVQRLQKLLF